METANNQQSVDSQPYIRAQIQAKEADVQALAELTRALDKKVIALKSIFMHLLNCFQLAAIFL